MSFTAEDAGNCLRKLHIRVPFSFNTIRDGMNIEYNKAPVEPVTDDVKIEFNKIAVCALIHNPNCYD